MTPFDLLLTSLHKSSPVLLEDGTACAMHAALIGSNIGCYDDVHGHFDDCLVNTDPMSMLCTSVHLKLLC